MSYSTARLEGRALEHCLAGQGGDAIRMKSGSGKWERVRTAQTKEIMKVMKARVEQLWEDLEAYSLFRAGADMQCYSSSCGVNSVDLLLKTSNLSQLGGNMKIVTEAKWTRQSIPVAMKSACKSLAWMKVACASGRWTKSKKPIKSDYMGFLVVKPRKWELRLRHIAEPSFRKSYPFSRPPTRVLRKRQSGKSGKSGKSGWVKWRGTAPPSSEPRWPSGWPAHNSKRS